MKTQYMTASLISMLAIGGAAHATVLLQDDFNSGGTPPNAGRVYEFLLDQGWQKTLGFGTPNSPSLWNITGGQLVNPANTDPTGNGSQWTESESPVWIWWTNPSAGSNSDTLLNVSFDYSVGSGDSLTAHLWAVQTGATPTTTNPWITNNQGWVNGNSGQNEDVSNGGYDTFNLLDGDTTPDNPDNLSGALTGASTFNWQVDVSTLGIAGVSNVGDIDGFFFAIAANETGGGASSVDNLLINSVPEPGSLALLGLGGLLIARRRRN